MVRMHTSWSQRMGCTGCSVAAGAVGEGVVGGLLGGGGAGGSLRVHRRQARPHGRHLRGGRTRPLHLCGRQQKSKNGAPEPPASSPRAPPAVARGGVSCCPCHRTAAPCQGDSRALALGINLLPVATKAGERFSLKMVQSIESGMQEPNSGKRTIQKVKRGTPVIISHVDR